MDQTPVKAKKAASFYENVSKKVSKALSSKAAWEDKVNFV